MKTCPRCLTSYADSLDVCDADGEKLVSAEALPPVDTSLKPGTQVGEYVIEDRLGEGGFGSVYRAEHPVIGKRVAIKLLHAQYSSNPQMVARFVAEARAVNQIRHPNIVDIFAFGQIADGRRYYVMELLEGVPLDKLLSMGGPMPPELALPLLRGIVRALDAAHATGIAHRDLKPENVFIAVREGARASAKLLDFGIAKLLSDSAQPKSNTVTGAPLGTPHYMSPEQCRGRAVDHRTDIYSLGILLHRVLTGRQPFEASDPVELLNQQVSAPAPWMSSVLKVLPPAMDEPVLRMLEKDPERRPTSIAEAMDALLDAAVRAGIDVSPDATDVDIRALLDSSGNLGEERSSRIPKARDSKKPRPHDPSADTLPQSAPPTQAPAKAPTQTSNVAWQEGGRPSMRGQKRTWLAPIVAVVGLLALAALALGLKSGGDRGVGSAASARGDDPPVTASRTSPPVEAPVLSAAAPSTVAGAQTASLSAEVTLTISSVPPGTKVYAGETLLGTAPGALRVARNAQPVSLRFVTEDQRTAQVDVVPDQDRAVAVALPAVKGSRAPGVPAPTRPKDLEPF